MFLIPHSLPASAVNVSFLSADSPLGGLQGHEMNISGGGSLLEMLRVLTLPSPLASSLIPFSPSQSLPVTSSSGPGGTFLGPVFAHLWCPDLLGPHHLSFGLRQYAFNGLPAWSCQYLLYHIGRIRFLNCPSGCGILLSRAQPFSLA